MPDQGASSGTGGIGAGIPSTDGADPSAVTLAEIRLSAVWNVQGDPARVAFLEETQRRFAIPLPLVPNTTMRGSAWTALWIGPRSWLLVAHGATGLESQLAAFPDQRDALNAAGGALFDLSASRVVFAVEGMHAASVLAKKCPLDFHLRAFPAGTCAQSLLGHVSALIERPDAAPAFNVMVARSLACDVWRALCLTAAQYGYCVAASRSPR